MTWIHQTAFGRLHTGEAFSKNGNRWVKQSNRTARLDCPNEAYHGKWFYFRACEPVNVSNTARKKILERESQNG